MTPRRMWTRTRLARLDSNTDSLRQILDQDEASLRARQQVAEQPVDTDHEPYISPGPDDEA